MHGILGGTGHTRSALAQTFLDRDEPQEMALRITKPYRREDGAWALVLRHAHALKADDETL